MRPRLHEFYDNPRNVLRRLDDLDENTFIIGYARRIVPYKRAMLLFRNLDRLAKIINESEVPVLILLAGKAHPSDGLGLSLIRQIIDLSKEPELQGRIIFLENYDIETARYLTRGVDVWLNTPERLMEASGTSGMKAALNGVINFSVADGWWAEAVEDDVGPDDIEKFSSYYSSSAGWVLPKNKIYENQDLQDEEDAVSIYRLLEDEIIPLYLNTNENGIPTEWTRKMKNSMTMATSSFLMKRVVDDYLNKFYLKLKRQNEKTIANNFENARKIAGSKKKMMMEWEDIEVVSMNVFDSANKSLPIGNSLKANITLNLNEISSENVGVELVFVKKRETKEISEILFKKELTIVEVNDSKIRYEADIRLTNPGVYEYGFRIFPKYPLLEYRQDFGIIKWI